MSGASIGIMDPAYFVGRKEILNWINDTLALNLTKIEDTATGAVACQIADMIYPGDVSMAKVKWDCKSDHEFVNNYKVLQRCLDKHGVEKHIEVEKLCRAKYQDNLEFMQWLKSFFDKNYSGAPYDPVARRAIGRGANAVTGNASGAGGIRKPASTRPVAVARQAGAADSEAVAPSKPAAAPRAGGVAPAKRPAPSSAGPTTSGDGSALAKRVEQLDVQVADLKLSVEGLEKERDFYFGKLRDIEILLQAYTGTDQTLSKQIFDILYATEEDFVVAEEGEKENLS